MNTKSRLLTISILIEQDDTVDELVNLRTDYQIQQEIMATIEDLYADQDNIRITWQSTYTASLDSQPAVGRCIVCDRWVYDIENATSITPRGISRGAVVDGQYLCDEHLPPGHPHCFGNGYEP